MGTSKLVPSQWMYKDGTNRSQYDIVKKAGGWYKVVEGQADELLHALRDEGNAAPVIDSVTNHADGTYSSGTSLSFIMTFGEAVTVVETGGTPYMEVWTAAGDKYQLAYASGSGGVALTFTGTTVGIANGTLVVGEIQPNGGTILDAAGNSIDNDFPSDYTQPAIELDTTVMSAVTNYADGDYADTEVLSFTLAFDNAVTVVGSPLLQVSTDAGVTPIDISYTSGSPGTDLVFSAAPTGIADGDLTVELILDLNTGTMNDAAGNPVELAFPADYVQPVITMTTP